MKNLIVYYSRKGQNYLNGSVGNLEKGNTEVAAETIEKAVGGDLFEVETIKSYSEDYFTCTREAKAELQANARPGIKRFPGDVSEYDNIFVGYPNWWGTMPMAMFTLLERYDFTGKKIIPFCTNEGSGMGASERDLAKICKGAKIAKGIAIKGSSVAAAASTIAAWARESIS